MAEENFHGEGMNEGKLASLKDQQEMWGGRASRALEALNGKSTGKTSYEQESLKRKRKLEEQAKQRRIEAETLSNKKGLRRGASRASLKRKRKIHSSTSIIQRIGLEGPVTEEIAFSRSTEPSNESDVKLFRDRLERFYNRYAPSKKANIEKLLNDKEADVMNALRQKYGPEPDEHGEPSSSPQPSKAATRPIKKAKQRSAPRSIQKDTDGDIDEGMGDLDDLNAQNVAFFVKQVREKPRGRS